MDVKVDRTAQRFQAPCPAHSYHTAPSAHKFRRVPLEMFCTRSTLPTAAEAQQQIAPQLCTPALASMCLLVQSAALAPVWSSIFRQHAGCNDHSPLPLKPSHAETWCPHRPVFHESRRSTITRPYVSQRFVFSASQQLQPPLVSTHFRCNVLHAGIAR